jgi:tRNA G18 (ribose-2'-O)-methylase SpoU
MPLIPIDTLSDSRVAHYRNLKDRELERRGQRFIAEGEHIVRRLLASEFTIESLLLAERRVGEMAPLTRPELPVYAVRQELMNEILGMKFHSGVLACGVRKPPPPLEKVILRDRLQLTLVICPDITNVENIGSMVRIAAAFGVDAMILGEQCHDPFWRQSIRVSMGAIFNLPLVQSRDLMRDLHQLRQDYGVQLAATVLDQDAEPLSRAPRPAKLGLLFGSEPQGLSPAYVAACDRRLTIPMHLGTDSLNVAVATAVFLYHFTNEAGSASAGGILRQPNDSAR